VTVDIVEDHRGRCEDEIVRRDEQVRYPNVDFQNIWIVTIFPLEYFRLGSQYLKGFDPIRDPASCNETTVGRIFCAARQIKRSAKLTGLPTEELAGLPKIDKEP